MAPLHMATLTESYLYWTGTLIKGLYPIYIYCTFSISTEHVRPEDLEEDDAIQREPKASYDAMDMTPIPLGGGGDAGGDAGADSSNPISVEINDQDVEDSKSNLIDIEP